MNGIKNLMIQVHQSGLGWQPVYPVDNLAVISIGFLLDVSPQNPCLALSPQNLLEGAE